MDDLGMLRDLGRELEHEPPASLVRQRQRLTGARPRRSRPAGWALVTAITAALILVPVAFLRGGGTDGAPMSGLSSSAKPRGPLTVLALGVDKRYGRADTMVLLHLSRDGERAWAVSLPRDLRVGVPGCADRPPRTDRLGSVHQSGGLDCALTTVRTLTGLRVDHALSIDFAGFRTMVDALGGVDITLREPVPPLGLTAGRHLLNGRAALAFARLRHIDTGSDLDRIKRQQQLMAALVTTAERKLTDLPAQARFLKAAGSAVRTTSAFDLATLRSLAGGLKGPGPDAVRYTTVPVRPHPSDPGLLALNVPAARDLFEKLKKDA